MMTLDFAEGEAEVLEAEVVAVVEEEEGEAQEEAATIFTTHSKGARQTHNIPEGKRLNKSCQGDIRASQTSEGNLQMPPLST